MRHIQTANTTQIDLTHFDNDIRHFVGDTYFLWFCQAKSQTNYKLAINELHGNVRAVRSWLLNDIRINFGDWD